MRRICALVLVAIFSLQTTASAASPGQTQGPNLQPLLSAIEGSQIAAVVTGQEARYAAMHAPAPAFPTLHDSGVRPNMTQSRSATTAVGPGTMIDLASQMGLHPFNRSGARPDPLVMAASASSASAHRGGTSGVRAVATPRPVHANTGKTLHAMATYSSSAAPTTGVNPWWTYEEKPLAGVGKALVNVANGNLLVQADDVDVAERGIDLAFRRTYNSQSTHDNNNTDGTSPSVFGNGWTNTFDVHIAHDTTNNVMSVYDLDGARYDYTANTSSVCAQSPTLCWLPPPGMQGTTLYTNGNCAYAWTKKNGTTYTFYSPDTTCDSYLTANAGYAGRIYQIAGRNSNNALGFVYWWNTSGDSTLENISTISVVHSDGQRLLLNFGQFWNNTELVSITRPDGQQITYSYDPNGNLLFVTRPGNAVDDATRTQTITSLTEEYWYYSGTHEMAWVAGPRYVWSSDSDGSTYEFSYSVNTTGGQLTWISDYGLMNFAPNDGTGTALQTGSTAANSLYRQTEFVYNYNSTGLNVMRDTDGHASQWQPDSSNRVVMTSDFAAAGDWLVTQSTWDANNNLTASVDPRGNETDYTYDANGNTLSVAKPSVSTSIGTGRPTSVFTYDQYNNLISYCDPNYEWPSGTVTCGQVSGATYYVYNYNDTYEPFGQLTDTYTPLGYHHSIQYSTSAEGGDYGLPTSVTGASYTQNDGTVRTPTQTFTYDTFGNLATYNKGNGAWTLTYDSLNRLVQRIDPDNVSSYTCYNADGSVSLTRSASQYAADGNALCASITPAASAGVAKTYDPDGNDLTERHHHGCTALSGCGVGLASKWYDGEDRLVEVKQPQDGNDAYAFPWMTRYIYDITAGQPVSITGGASGFLAYGNLYKTQECIQGTSVQLTDQYSPLTARSQAINAPIAPTVTGACTFQDLRGNTFDALDRSLTKYEVAAGSSPEQTSIYDTNGEYGLLSEKTNPTGQTDTLSYDNDGHLSTEAFSDGVTPNRSYSYDPDGREVSLNSATMGTQTRTYDADSRLTSASDPSNEQDPGTISYSYYGDGLRSSLSLSVPGLTFSQSNLFAYSYRPDGLRSSLVSAVGVGNRTFAWTYSNAGREQSQSDPLTGITTGSNTLVAKSLTYDGYGRLSGLTLPRGYNPESNIANDLEDSIVNATWTGAATGSYQFTTRNEVPGVTSGSTSMAYAVQYANGASCTNATTCTFDSRSGQMLTQQLNYNETGLANPTHAYAYDGAGRETGDTLTCGATSPVTGTRAYDTDNHIIQQALPSLYTATNSCSVASTQQTLNYSWGADGRLANFSETQYAGGTTTAMQAAHWDGDDLLYVSYEGVAMTLYVEKLGVIWQSSNASNTWYTMVYDRDQTGTAVNEHFSVGASMGFSMLTIDNIHPFLRNCSAKTSICSVSGVPPSPSIGGPEGADPYQTPQTLLLDAAREDGYFDGTLSIQGARAYDPNMNQWTTPDAYSGEVHDPMSQHPYMWNSNNPVDYQDPTGYCSIAEPASCLAAVANAVKSVAQSPATAAVAKTIGKVAATTAGDALIVAGFVAATTAEDGDQHAESPVEGASLENVTGTGIAVYGKPGDAETAEDDFNGLKPTNVVERGSGTTTGTLANGDTVVVRDSSTKDSRPTLEVHHKGEIIVKVRYGAKPPPK